MVFSNLSFLFFFLPIVVVVYFCVPKPRRNIVLFISNLVFYFWAEPVFILLLFAVMVLNYSVGLFLDKNRERILPCRLIFWGTIALHLLLLLLFKFQLFIPTGTSSILQSLIIPLGISVYIFQGLSYTIDIYLQKTQVQTSFVDFGVYLAFFPQLICGPILRYSDMRTELSEREETAPKIANGYGLFIVGLAKKIFIADPLLTLWLSVKTLSESSSIMTSWLGIFSFSLAIYFYFSGYSQMARGIAKVFGFDIPANFNYPYISKNIVEFSRRWNTSLVNWFKNYLFTPIAHGNNSIILTVFKLLAIWILVGMWYGGSLNFMLWGFYLGVFIIIERLFLIDLLAKTPVLVQRIYTIFVLLLGWVIFEMDSLSQMGSFYASMFSGEFLNDTTLYYIGRFFPALLLGIFALTNHWHGFVLRQEQENAVVVRRIRSICTVLLTVVCVIYLVAGQHTTPEFFIRF